MLNRLLDALNLDASARNRGAPVCRQNVGDGATPGRHRKPATDALRAPLIGVLLLLTGCASLPGANQIQIGQRRVEYLLTSGPNPPIIFENGLGGTLDWWAKVYPEVKRSSAALAYNRAGYGESIPLSAPRDGAHIVGELRSLLAATGLKPPYILVGHSVGGLYMQYFARRYPDEVAGVVLVDSTHPRQMQGKGARENWPFMAKLVVGAMASATAGQELDAMNATGDEVLALPPATGKPVIVLSARTGDAADTDYLRDLEEKRRDIVTLFPGATQDWVDGGHAIPLDHPEAVIAAIRKVVEAASRSRP